MSIGPIYHIEKANDGGFVVKKVSSPDSWQPIVFAASNIDEALLYIRAQMVTSPPHIRFVPVAGE